MSREVLRLAERQHGVVSRQQLLDLGVGPQAVRHRWATGRLVRVRRGVYALGHRALRPQGRWMAAVLACGPGAVLSHGSAARLWGIRPWSGDVEVTIATDRGRKVDDVIAHRAEVSDWEVTTEDAIPVTTVARTLLDLAAVVPPHHLRRAVERAEQLELFDLRGVERVLAAHPRRKGRRRLVALLDDACRHDLATTRSDVEAAFLQLCLDDGLPRPIVNHINNGTEVDFRWPEHRLVIEIDGWATHRTRKAFVDDRVRDRALVRDGERVVRFAAAEVLRARRGVAAEVRVLLAG
jgi:predicted transcriptional regulator of viral defense system